MLPEELVYTKTHEWVKVYKNNIVRIGVTDYAQSQFGNIVFVELPAVDEEHEQFDAFIVIEGENMLSEIYAPLSGKVVNVNDDIEEDPTIINHDPYGDGWIVEMELSHEDEVDMLMSFEEYSGFVENPDKES